MNWTTFLRRLRRLATHSSSARCHRPQVTPLEERVNPAPVQYFYIPMPEAMVNASFDAIVDETVSTTQVSITSISVTENNTVIHYDQWEDGYEAILGNPLQSSTQVWGDNNNANGIAPGFANDPNGLAAGTVLRLRNNVDVPRNLTTQPLLFDSPDRFGSDKTVSVSRAQFPTVVDGGGGSVIASAVEVRDTRFYDTNYTAPVGTDTADAGEMFQFTRFFVQAFLDNTLVRIDANHDGDYVDAGDVNQVLNQGQTVVSGSNVLQGGRVVADKPVQVQLMTGDVNANFASRSYTLFSDGQRANDYFTPVGYGGPGDNTDDEVRLFVFNPNATAITVTPETSAGLGTAKSVPAGGTTFFDVTTNSGTRLFSTQTFLALGTHDQQGTTHDWGFSLQPVSALSQIALVGLGVGNSDNLPATSPNTSPIFVTALGTTTLQVDHNGDGTVDQTVPVTRLQSVRLRDTTTTDNDNSGMRIYTEDGTLISVVWGEDGTAPDASPGFDAGTTVPAIPVPEFYKFSTFAPGGDVNGDGLFNEGDTIRYSLRVRHIGSQPISNAVVTDTLPPQVTYIANSTTITPAGLGPINDSGSGTAFPLDVGGFEIETINPGQTIVVSFDARINTGLPAGFNFILNQSLLTFDLFRLPANDVIDLRGIVGDRVWYDIDANGTQDAGEPGIPGATVTLTWLGANGVAGGGDDQTFTRTTGANGIYSFSNLPAGNFTTAVTGLPFGLTAQTAGVASFSLPSGQVIRNDIDFGYRGTATVGNFVWEDLNANGVQNAGEPGVAGAAVALTWAGPDGSLATAADNVVITTTTSATGAYNFPGLPTGTFQAQFTTPAGYTFSPLDQGGNDATDSDSAVATGLTASFTLAAGATNNDLDAGMYRRVTIGDVVFRDLDADGVQDAGETGLSNVTVRLLDSGNAVLQTTTTNASGAYSFTNLVPGTYSVEFVLPAGNLFSPQDQGGNDATDSDANTATGRTAQFTVTSNQTDNSRDAGLYQPASLGDFVFTDFDADGVQDAAEPGVNNVTVRLRNAGGIVTTTTTNASGAYSFTGLTPGTYFVEFVAPAGYLFGPQDQGGNDALDSDANATGQTAPFTLTSGQSNQTLDAGLYQTVSIGDVVFRDLDADGVQEAGETGLSNVTVRLLDSGNAVLQTTTTNASGIYGFSGLTPGTYSVEFVTPAGFNFSPLDQGGNDNLDSDANTATGRTTPFTLTSSQADASRDAGLYRFVSIGDFVWTDLDADGVQDAGEPGLDNVTVRLRNAGGIVTTTTTNAAGAYSFTGVTPGTYFVEFVAPAGYLFGPQDQGGNDALDSDANATGQTATFTLIEGQSNPTLDAALYQPVTIGDLVWEDLDADGVQDAGEPGLASVTVNLRDAGGGVASTTTNASGAYSFTGLTPGTYFVEFVAPAGYLFGPQDQDGNDAADSDANTAGQTAPFTLTSGQTTQAVDASLYQPAAVTGLAFRDLDGDGVQAPGEPGLDNVTVRLLDANDNVLQTTTTNGSGLYSFSNLVPGTYSVEFVSPTSFNGSPQDQGGDDTLDSDPNPATGRTAPFALVSGQTDDTRDAGLFRYATIGDFVWEDLDGNGLQDAGEPGVANATVRLLDLANNVLATTTTNASGFYLFGNLVPGNYRVEFVAPTGYVFTLLDVGSNNGADSDANLADGRTVGFTRLEGDTGDTIDAGLYRPVTIGDFVWDDLDADGVQDAGEPGLNGVTVHLRDANGIVATTTTNAAGSYSFPAVVPGTYRVEFVAPGGYLFSPPNQASDPFDSDPDASGQTPSFPVQSGDVADTIDAGLYRLATVGDVVWNDLDADGVQEPGEPGLGNVTVRLLDANGSVVATTTTNGSGTYSFNDLTPGSYRVEFVAPPGFVFATPAGGQTPSFPLTSGQIDTTRDAGLTQLSSFSGSVYRDRNGNGIREAGEPGLAGVPITLTGTGPRGQLVDLQTTTDGNGDYHFAGLLPGTYTITEAQPGGFLDGREAVGSPGGSTSNDQFFVTLPAGVAAAGYTFGEVEPAGISGVVFEDANRNGRRDRREKPLRGAVVVVTGTDDLGNTVTLRTTTGADGTYRFAGLRPGNYTISITPPKGYKPVTSRAGTAGGVSGLTSIRQISLAGGLESSFNLFGLRRKSGASKQRLTAGAATR